MLLDKSNSRAFYIIAPLGLAVGRNVYIYNVYICITSFNSYWNVGHCMKALKFKIGP